MEPLHTQPLTPDRWNDLEKLFGPRGACAGCWCMWWRLTNKEFEQRKGDDNGGLFKAIVEAGEEPGILAYSGDEPVGWCAIAPREVYTRLEGDRVRVLKRVDDKPVWSVTCFFVTRPFRHKGVTVQLLQAAIDYAANHGAGIVEGYPVDTREGQSADAFVYTGTLSAFRKAGFVEVLRRSETRPIMRYYITG